MCIVQVCLHGFDFHCTEGVLWSSRHSVCLTKLLTCLRDMGNVGMQIVHHSNLWQNTAELSLCSTQLSDIYIERFRANLKISFL
jgi:hypothetical protein